MATNNPAEAEESRVKESQDARRYFDAPCSDDERRGRLFNGQLFLFSPRPSVTALREFARRMVEEAFAPLDPRTAQFHMPVEQYVAILARLKPAFIHHPDCKDAQGDPP